MQNQREHFKELLRSRGLKMTHQREKILGVFESRPNEHFTAEEIYELVRVECPEIGLATVYRTIQLFSELRLIDRLNLDDGYTRYEIGKKDVEGHHHHHIICLNCGKVDMFEDDLLDNLENRIYEQMGFHVTDHEVKLYGYCKDCMDKAGEKHNKI
ncbi:MAG: Fur family transcriptional regulator [Lachnospiraceae bacterium]|nr:Fur family transcriptional regulator [Lachnospiraceae bacterium]